MEWMFEEIINARPSQTAYSLKPIRSIESFLVEFNDIFTRHRLNIGYTHKLSVKLTTDTDRPVYWKTPRISINLKDDWLVELARLQYYGVIITSPFSRYSSPIFAKRNSNGKLRILVDVRKKPFDTKWEQQQFPNSNTSRCWLSSRRKENLLFNGRKPRKLFARNGRR